MLNINRLYQYVFGSLRDPLPFMSQLSLEINEKRQVKHEQETLRFFYDLFNLSCSDTQILLPFPENFAEEKLAQMFRILLCNVGAHYLENVLYGSNKKYDYFFKIFQQDYQFPDEEKIKRRLQFLNAQYNYDIHEADYIVFFKACKLIADYAERNNFVNNEIAYLNAYKILVLFGKAKSLNPFKAFEDFLARHNYSSHEHPVHDALTCPLPENMNITKYLDDWRKFIQDGGFQTLKIFQRASEIQEMFGKVPASIAEGKEMLSQIGYQTIEYSEEDSELVALCRQYLLPEKTLKKCLNIFNKRKQYDLLPTVMVNGEEINCPGYFFLKLPINDRRACILGQITQCCQSIGSHAEPCVIDGITRIHNGFYVLLKQKKTASQEALPVINGEINYGDYEIIGQSYAWLSRARNLTLDSLELLRSSDDAIASAMVVQWSIKVTQSYPEISRVTIGEGKTPKKLKKTCVDYPEQMEEGYQYGDSRHTQYLVYQDEAKLKILRGRIQEIISSFWEAKLAPLFFSLSQNELIQSFDRIHSLNEWNSIQELLLNSPSFSDLLSDTMIREQLNQVLKTKEIPFIWHNIIQLHAQNILQPNNMRLILSFPIVSDTLSELLCELNEVHALTLDIQELILNICLNKVNNEEKEKEEVPLHLLKLVIKTLKELKQAKILNQENIRILLIKAIQSTAYFDEILNVTKELNEAHLLTQENFEVLVAQQFQHLRNLYSAVYELNKVHFLTQKTLTILNKNPETAKTIGITLAILYKIGGAQFALQNYTTNDIHNLNFFKRQIKILKRLNLLHLLCDINNLSVFRAVGSNENSQPHYRIEFANDFLRLYWEFDSSDFKKCVQILQYLTSNYNQNQVLFDLLTADQWINFLIILKSAGFKNMIDHILKLNFSDCQPRLSNLSHNCILMLAYQTGDVQFFKKQACEVLEKIKHSSSQAIIVMMVDKIIQILEAFREANRGEYINLNIMNYLIQDQLCQYTEKEILAFHERSLSLLKFLLRQPWATQKECEFILRNPCVDNTDKLNSIMLLHTIDYPLFINLNFELLGTPINTHTQNFMFELIKIFVTLYLKKGAEAWLSVFHNVKTNLNSVLIDSLFFLHSTGLLTGEYFIQLLIRPQLQKFLYFLSHAFPGMVFFTQDHLDTLLKYYGVNKFLSEGNEFLSSPEAEYIRTQSYSIFKDYNVEEYKTIFWLMLHDERRFESFVRCCNTLHSVFSMKYLYEHLYTQILRNIKWIYHIEEELKKFQASCNVSCKEGEMNSHSIGTKISEVIKKVIKENEQQTMLEAQVGDVSVLFSTLFVSRKRTLAAPLNEEVAGKNMKTI